MKRIGDIGERSALEYLIRHGYTLLDKNIRLGHWEADLVVFQGPLLVVVEVKSSLKRTVTQAEGRITRSQLARLIGLGTFLVKRNTQFKELRIDLMLVHLKTSQNQIRHYKDISSYI